MVRVQGRLVQVRQKKVDKYLLSLTTNINMRHMLIYPFSNKFILDMSIPLNCLELHSGRHKTLDLEDDI